MTATRSAWRGLNTTAPWEETGDDRDVFGDDDKGDDGSAELCAGAALGDERTGGGGAALGEAIAEWGYCVLFDPLDSEEWRMLDASQVVAPAEPMAPATAR